MSQKMPPMLLHLIQKQGNKRFFYSARYEWISLIRTILTL